MDAALREAQFWSGNVTSQNPLRSCFMGEMWDFSQGWHQSPSLSHQKNYLSGGK